MTCSMLAHVMMSARPTLRVFARAMHRCCPHAMLQMRAHRVALARHRAFRLEQHRRGQRVYSSALADRQQLPVHEWEGLRAWRQGVNDVHAWSTEGSGKPCRAAGGGAVDCGPLPGTLAECGRLVLNTADPHLKMALTHSAFARWCTGSLPLGSTEAPACPARPDRPVLVSMKETPTPERSPLPLNAHVLHTVAHIEYNAINLAWDTVTRFSALPLPAQFFADFARVADDEARHLGWCLQRLAELGHSYGDLPSHNALWEGAAASAYDVIDRLVVVPCVQEARGLDAGPKLAERLVGAGDNRSAAIIRRIASEELAHVAVGVSWLREVALARDSDPGGAFRQVVASHYPEGLRGPFNHHIRNKVGLPREWYASQQQSQEVGNLRERLERLVASEAHRDA